MTLLARLAVAVIVAALTIWLIHAGLVSDRYVRDPRTGLCFREQLLVLRTCVPCVGPVEDQIGTEGRR